MSFMVKFEIDQNILELIKWMNLNFIGPTKKMY